MANHRKKTPENPADNMGQSAIPGEPDADAVAAVAAANRVPAGAVVAEPAEEPERQEPELMEPIPAVAADQKAELLRLLEDPDIATQIVKVASSTPEGRSLLQLPVGKGVPSGVYRRDYDSEEALKVHGGVEVRHPSFERGDSEPLPPESIPRYLREDGTTTVYDKPYIEQRRQSIPMRGEDGKIVVNEDGNQVHTDQFVDVVVDPGPAFEANGKPKKTPAYKTWTDALVRGQRLDGDVISDLAHAQDQGAHPVALDGATGAPVLV